MLAAAGRALRGAAIQWEEAEGSWATWAEACKDAKTWPDMASGGAAGMWSSYYSRKGRLMVLRCNAHKDCPRQQKVALNGLSGRFERFAAFEHAGEANDRRRSNSALTLAQERTLTEGLDMGAKPMEVLNAVTKTRRAELKAQGKNPLLHKKPEGGLKGHANIIHYNSL